MVPAARPWPFPLLQLTQTRVSSDPWNLSRDNVLSCANEMAGAGTSRRVLDLAGRQGKQPCELRAGTYSPHTPTTSGRGEGLEIERITEVSDLITNSWGWVPTSLGGAAPGEGLEAPCPFPCTLPYAALHLYPPSFLYYIINTVAMRKWFPEFYVLLQQVTEPEEVILGVPDL